MAGSFVVPALLIPLIAGLYKQKIKYPILMLILPPLVAISWHLYGTMYPTIDGYPGYIWGLDPMYPGVLVSIMLYILGRRQRELG
jgi:hypothetical protein